MVVVVVITSKANAACSIVNEHQSSPHTPSLPFILLYFHRFPQSKFWSAQKLLLQCWDFASTVCVPVYTTDYIGNRYYRSGGTQLSPAAPPSKLPLAQARSLYLSFYFCPFFAIYNFSAVLICLLATALPNCQCAYFQTKERHCSAVITVSPTTECPCHCC